MSAGAFEVNGITDAMLMTAPLIDEVMDDILDFIGDACLIGHNVKFDLKFLNGELDFLNRPTLDDVQAIDTVKMSRGLLPGLGRYSLANVARHLGVKQDQIHRAMSDVEITHRVFASLLDLALENNVMDFDSLINLFGIQKRKSQHKNHKLKIIEEAISSQVQLTLLYLGVNSGATSRRVTPKKVQGLGKQATLVGHCHLRNEERRFVVDKIIKLEP